MSGRFEIFVRSQFSAAHCLSGYAGDCARFHGHNWTVEVFVESEELDELGMGVDFRDIHQALQDVLSGLDHQNLNELPAFEKVNPTSENVARLLYRELGSRLNSNRARVCRVKVFEMPDAGVTYWED